MLEIKNISIKYNKKAILDDVSFNVKKGEVCGLLGLNGAGKSTLMKIIARLVKPLSGEILYDGKSIDNQIGYMIEEPVFYKDVSGENNLKLLSILYENITSDRINLILNKVGLEEHKKKLFKNYSLGMKQRLYFAYALINNPKIIILDEPFNGIDPITSKLFKDLIQELAQSGCTILVSSHIISDIKEVSDKIIILDNGIKIYDNSIKAEDNIENIFISKVSNKGSAQ